MPRFVRYATLFATLCFAFVGCDKKDAKPVAAPGIVDSDPPPVEDHKAPHGGQLIELGEEEYHAELVVDEGTGLVTIYLLDGELKKDVPIPAKELNVNLTVKGKPQPHVLTAKPQEKDPAGQSSRFESTGKELHEALEDHDTKGRLGVEINGKAYSGEVKHQH